MSYTCPKCGDRGDYWQARAEKAERLLAPAVTLHDRDTTELLRLRVGIQALADEWGAGARTSHEAGDYGYEDACDRHSAALRGLLSPTPEGTP